ncbi:MAG: hypothetical protein ABIO04_02705 [Ferruginibacter sp.]
MINNIQIKLCVSCNKAVKGRTDKKFCDDYCRNNYNNQLKADTNNLLRNINNALSKNRRILEGLIIGSGEMAKINKDQLIEKGFMFKYCTHIYINKKGSTYFYCYDYGYLPLDNEYYLIVKSGNE